MSRGANLPGSCVSKRLLQARSQLITRQCFLAPCLCSPTRIFFLLKQGQTLNHPQATVTIGGIREALGLSSAFDPIRGPGSCVENLPPTGNGHPALPLLL
jgi:hypothetical protein